MILTFKIKHNRDFSKELEQAKKIAEFAINNRMFLSSKNIKHIGLKSAISNQVLRKYGKNKKCKSVKSVKLTIPNQSIRVNHDNCLINIPCIKLELNYRFNNNFIKINQVEIDNTYAYIACEYKDKPEKDYIKSLGVDLNATGHCAVVSIPDTGKVYKLGKRANHIHVKYKNIRKNLQKNRKFNALKKIKNRESRIVKDLNHKISRKIINLAEYNKCIIKLEDLKGIRKTTKTRKSFKYALNSWSFCQLQKFIEYKAKKQGLKVVYIAPEYTSKTCSRCGLIGNRNDKSFKCPNCGHVDNADCNAGFNIAKRLEGMCQSVQDRDCKDGCTDTPKKALGLKLPNLKTSRF